MLKKFFITIASATVLASGNLSAHCQMPCGIYHDDMVFDFIDQYIETMFKALSVMTDSPFATVRERNEFCRWVYEKEMESDDVAKAITCYFLQQKIKPGEADTAEKLASAHRLLFLLTGMKQNVDKKILAQFGKEWSKFKNMFHIEGYECAMERMKKKQRDLDDKMEEAAKNEQK